MRQIRLLYFMNFFFQTFFRTNWQMKTDAINRINERNPKNNNARRDLHRCELRLGQNDDRQLTLFSYESLIASLTRQVTVCCAFTNHNQLTCIRLRIKFTLNLSIKEFFIKRLTIDQCLTLFYRWHWQSK